MKQKEKRTRCQNFSLHEEDILVSLVEQHKDVVESKKIDGKTSKQKTETWEKIQDTFCAHTDTYRTAKMLREKYENMKKKAKLLMTKTEESEASSCSCSQLRNTTIQRLIDIIAEANTSLENSIEEDNKEKLKGEEEVGSETEIEGEVLNIAPEVQISTHENWSRPATKSKKSFRQIRAKQRKILNYEDTTLRAAKAKLIFFENEELRAVERHEWERELSEKRSKWEDEINKKKLELLDIQIENEKLQTNNTTATLTGL